MTEQVKRRTFAILAADIIIFSMRDGELVVRLCHVERPPYFPDNVAFPGGLIAPSETAEMAAQRLVRDKGNLDCKPHLEQLYTFSEIERDPRGRVVAVAYIALVPWNELKEHDKANSKSAWWSTIKDARKLAYDHDQMLKIALKRLESRITYTTLVQELLPKEFTLTELEQTYSVILGTHLDKRNFRKKILALGILTATKKMKTGSRSRPARLYSFSTKKVTNIQLL